MRKNRAIFTTVASVLLLGAHATFAAGGKVVRFSGDTIYPESATWSEAQHEFFIGSTRHGYIATVDMQGHVSKFVDDGISPSTFGIHVDDRNNRLWVIIGDIGLSERSVADPTKKPVGVAVYDSRSGARLAYYDITTLDKGTRFANDLTLDASGNAYVTDSVAEVIYRIDSKGKITVFADNPLFKTGAGFGLNGIAYHPDGYLLIGIHNTGELLKVSLSDPSKVERVQLPESFKGMDGIALRDSRHLFISENLGANKAVEFVSTDGWKSAKIVRVLSTFNTFPTAVVKAGRSMWILESRMDSLLDPTAQKVSEFTLEQFNGTQKKTK